MKPLLAYLTMRMLQLDTHSLASYNEDTAQFYDMYKI